MGILKTEILKSNFQTFLFGFFQKINFKYFLVLSLVFCIPSFFSLLRVGFFPMQDDLQAFRLHQMDKCFSDFQIPCRWVPDAGYGYGYPQFNYYAPLVYYLGELFHLVGFQFIDAVKILFILGFLLGSLSIFLLVSKFTSSPFVGFVASVLFTYSPFRAQEVYVRGALSEFWAISLFPLVLFFSLKLIERGSFKNVGLLAITTSAFVLTHNLLPYILAPLAVFWTIYWMWRQKNYRVISKVILATLIGFGLSSFFVFPMIFERNLVHVESVLSGYFDYRRHFVSLSQMFLSNNFGYGSSDLGDNDELALNVGVVLLYTALSSIPLALFNYKKQKVFSYLTFFSCGLLFVSLFMMHLKSSFVWETITNLHWLQFPWRFLALSLVVSSILAGVTLKYLGLLRYGAGIVLIILVFILHGSFFQPKSWIYINDDEKFSGESWERQLTISIFDYLPKSVNQPPEDRAKDRPEIVTGKASILNFDKGSNFQKFNLEVQEAAKIRVQVFDFPKIEVLVDGSGVQFERDCGSGGEQECLGLISFYSDVGSHEVVVALKDTSVRTVSNLISLMSLGIVVFVSRKNEVDS